MTTSIQREIWRFAKQVAAGASGIIKRRVPRDARITMLTYRIYAGPETDLHLVPCIYRHYETRETIIQFVADGKKYIDGDDDREQMRVDVPVANDEEIVIEYHNTNVDNAYDFYVDIELTFEGVA